MNVELDKITFRWPGASRPMFDEVSLEIPANETTCLLGANGAGKTTLMELMLGWRKPEAGRIFFGGKNVLEMPSRERGRRMALVPQDERLPFSYSVIEYILLGRAPYLTPLQAPGRSDRLLAAAALERVGIQELASRPVPELSGGEMRLVLIARALVQQPDTLFLDEPANHLDPGNRERVIGILKSLRDSGITLIISSHEPDIVFRLAENIILLPTDGDPLIGRSADMLTAERLSSLYNVPVTIAEVNDRHVVLWGK